MCSIKKNADKYSKPWFFLPENITEPSYHNLWALQVDNKDGEATVKGRPGWVESMDWSDGQAAMTFSHHQAWPSFISNSNTMEG